MLAVTRTFLVCMVSFWLQWASDKGRADLLLARLTAPSSTLPMCPIVNMLATVREYCSKNVKINGLEYFASVFASRCHVVWILPAATASSHFLLMLTSMSSPLYGWTGSTLRRAVFSEGAPSSEPIAASSSAELLSFRNA